MAILILNEIKKIFLKKKTLVVIIGFVVLIGLICFGLYRDSVNQKLASSPESQQRNIQMQIDNLKQQQKDVSTSADNKKSIAESIANMEIDLQNIKNNKNTKIDWKETLKNQKVQIEQQLKTEINIPQINKDRENIQLKEIQYRLDNNIKPSEAYELSAFKYFDFLIEVLGSIFILIGILVFAADVVSGEYTPPTMKLLLTQPVSRAKVLLSKYLAAVISALGLILSIEAISFILMGFIFGFGNPLAPVSIGSSYQIDPLHLNESGLSLKMIAGSTHIIPMWQYALMNLGMEILFIITCVSFALLLSTILNSSMVSVVTGVVFTIVLFVLTNVAIIRKFTPYIFIFHGNSSAIFKGNLALQFSNSHITIVNSIVVMVIWIISCYTISHIVFTKKDILL